MELIRKIRIQIILKGRNDSLVTLRRKVNKEKESKGNAITWLINNECAIIDLGLELIVQMLNIWEECRKEGLMKDGNTRIRRDIKVWMMYRMLMINNITLTVLTPDIYKI